METVPDHVPKAALTDGMAARPNLTTLVRPIRLGVPLEANGTLGDIAHDAPADPKKCSFDAQQRKEMDAIALRCKSELCAAYSLVAVGLQSFCANYSTGNVTTRGNDVALSVQVLATN